jgi:hypothetical protein
MERSHLIICCAGDSSLHPMWNVPERTYDICVIYYGSNPDIANRYKESADLYFEGRGYKFGLIRDHIIPHYNNNPAHYSKYTQIWIPDDDIDMAPCDVERMFSFSDELGADIYQPSIANMFRPDLYRPGRQWISWIHTATNPNYKYRRINHPEIMMPGFSAYAFKHILIQSLIDYPNAVIGWGIDEYWELLWKKAHAGHKNNIYIYDHIYAFHTRPVSAGSIIHKMGEKESHMYNIKFHETMNLECFNI